MYRFQEKQNGFEYKEKPVDKESMYPVLVVSVVCMGIILIYLFSNL